MSLENFYNHLLDNMIPDNINQESMGVGDERYTADDWTLEVCKSLIEKKKYSEGSDYKIGTHMVLEKIKDDCDVLCVAEVGRGLDIAVANTIKKWRKVICYDHNPIYNEYLHRYFDDSVVFHNTSTNAFVDKINDYIDEKCIMVMNHTKFRRFDLLKQNKNIVHLIFNGDLI